MKILVSGGAGYIGSEVLTLAKQRGHEVYGFDSFNETLYPSDAKQRRAATLLKQGIEIEDWNPLTDSKKFDLPKFDVLINEMAIPGLVPSWSKIRDYMDSNVTAFAHLLNALSTVETKPFIVHASTSSVYGEKIGGKDTALEPISPYGVSKLAAEKLLEAYARQFGFEYSILRYFSVYGKEQRPDMAYSKFIRAALRGEEITLYGDGSQKRTNTHVSDVAMATLLTAEKQINGFTCDISGDETVELKQALDAIEAITGNKLKVERSSKSAGDQSVSEGNNSLAKQMLGWCPKVSFIDGITEQIEIERQLLV